MTWYSIVVLDVLLSCLLGRMPLTPPSDRYTAVLPPSSGHDEWELWRSESVDSLRSLYGNPLQHRDGQNSPVPSSSATSSFGFITPARTLSNFTQMVALARISHTILSVLNNVNRTDGGRNNKDLQRLHCARLELDGFASQLNDMQIDDSSLSSIPQHRVDLHLLWYNMNVLLYKELWLVLEY